MRRAATAAVLLALSAASSASATTEPSLIVGVKVALKANAVQLSTRSVNRGNYVRFGVRNTTASRRTFSLAGRRILVPARKLRYLVIMFDVRGRYAYVSRGTGTAVRGVFRVS